ncbi:nitrilase-related carbon-nitrogen hydrolase [Gulosibacter sediminis]|uniref:nitrilase-related carbon-nitrogen hydrolase n=1 Tax=Gulosibacter sediminis TaxID=1729695 RepID=UPI0024A8D991|nr:nitrilase-related carbon-nitrogen hydrolase [Gulosibacter sediminis]
MQASAAPLSPEKNLAAIRAAAVSSRANGAELLITPELFVTGYEPAALAEWMTPDRLAHFPQQLAQIAFETRISLVASFPSQTRDGNYAITAGFWDADAGMMLHYEKVHLWGPVERAAFTPSKVSPRVASWHGRRVGLQICYDIEFAEPARYLAAQGADLLLVPTAINADSEYIPDVLVRARAAENNVIVAYADYPATNAEGNTTEFAGKSIVAGVEGSVLAQAGRGETLLFAEIPDEQAAQPADYLRDRRPDIYLRWATGTVD